MGSNDYCELVDEWRYFGALNKEEIENGTMLNESNYAAKGFFFKSPLERGRVGFEHWQGCVLPRSSSLA